MPTYKSKPTTYVFALLLGNIGAHHFYLRHWVRGVIYVLLCWTFIPYAFTILIDLWFINRWVNAINSGASIGARETATKVKERSLKTSQEVPRLHSIPQSANRSPAMKNQRPVSTRSNTLSYDETAIILPQYSHIETPQSILDEVRLLIREFNSYGKSFFVTSWKSAKVDGRMCEPITLHAYYTTYDDLSEKQLNWYFYWRRQVLNGEYIPTDLSYLMLFTYELLNYSFNQNAAFNVSMLVRLYEGFKESMPQSSYYLALWIADALWELNDEALAREWDRKSYCGSLYQTSVEEVLRPQRDHLEKVSISVWKPFLSTRQSDFLIAHRNMVYNVFKQGIRLLADAYTEQGVEVLDLWFEDETQHEERDLFGRAVMARARKKVSIESTRRVPTKTFKAQLPHLFRMSENVLREKESKRKLQLDESVFPPGFAELFASEFKNGVSKGERFVKIMSQNDTEQGSKIPQPSQESQPERVVSLDFERLAHLKSESDMLVEELTELEHSLEQDGIEVVEKTKGRPPEAQPVVEEDYPTGDNSGRPMLSESEVAFLQQFDGQGVLAVFSASAYLRERGIMAGAFIDGINQKFFEVVDDVLIEQDGEDYVIDDDYVQIMNQMVKGQMANEFA